MLDSVAIWPVGLRVLDVNGKPVNDARLKFFDAGTSTPRVVYLDAALSVPLGAVIYTDAGGYPVTGPGSTTKTSIYTGTGAYKLRITTSADVDIVAPIDNISGALDTTALLAGAGTFARTVISKSDAAYTIDATQSGAVYQSNPTSGTQTATLPSAIDAGNSFACTIRHNGTLNAVKIAGVSNQPIHLPGGTTNAGFVLTAYGHSVDLVCDGAGWTVVQETPPLIGGTKGFIDIASRLTSPPTTPDPGARYIITGTPTGDWLARTAGDIAEATGQGGWTFYTPPANCGWCAYVKSEELLTQFRSTGWVDLPNITAPTSSTLRRMVVSHTATSGTSGGSTSAGAEVVRPFNTVDENTITTANGASGDASLATFQITLPAGTYWVSYTANVFNVNATTSRLKSTTTAKEVTSNNAFSATASGDSNIAMGMGVLTLTAPETFELKHLAAVTDSNGLGRANSIAGKTERHATLTIIDMSSLQGPRGVAGPQGGVGPAGGAGPIGAAAPAFIDYDFDTTSTADSDPGSGKWRANNTTPASVTTFYVDDLDRLGNSQASELATWDDSTSSGVKGKLYLIDLTTPAHRWTYDVTAYTAETGYSKLTVAHRSGAAAFASVNIGVLFVPRGDKGADGAGTGDVVGPAVSVDSELALFSATTGKLIKRASLSGIVKAVGGVAGAASAGSDFVAPGTATAFTAQQNATPSALTSGTAWDTAAKQNGTVNVNGSTFTVANPSNAVAGGFYTLFVTYTTSNTLGWGTAYKGVTSISPSATAGKYDNFVFRYDGTNMHCVGYRLDTGA